MSGIFFYVADCESSGLSLKMHEISQLSIIRASDRMQLSQQIRVDKPHLASYDALRITGKTMDDLRQGIGKLQAINEFEEFVNQDGYQPSHRCLVGHNIAFDRKFLCALWESFGRQFPFDLYLDTIPMFKEFVKKTGLPTTKNNLTVACEVAGIRKLGNAHSAKFDTRQTYLLWDKLSQTVDFMNHIKRQPHLPEE